MKGNVERVLEWMRAVLTFPRSVLQAGNLYIKNLDDEITDDKLREMFAPFGTITSAKVETNPDGTSKGFGTRSSAAGAFLRSLWFNNTFPPHTHPSGYVCFTGNEEATKAVTEMHGKMPPGNSKPLFVALHQSREDRRSRLEQSQQLHQQQLAQQAALHQQQQQQQLGMRMPLNANMYGAAAPMMYYVSFGETLGREGGGGERETLTEGKKADIQTDKQAARNW